MQARKLFFTKALGAVATIALALPAIAGGTGQVVNAQPGTLDLADRLTRPAVEFGPDAPVTGAILVYDANTNHQLAWQAAQNIAGAGAVLAGSADFDAKLAMGGWDCVAVDCPSTIPAAGWGALEAYVNNGGRVVMMYWNWDAEPGITTAMGATGTVSDVFWDGTCLTDMGTSGVFLGVSMPNCDWHNHWSDDGDQFQLAGGSVGLAQQDGAGGPVMFAGNDGATIGCSVMDEAGDHWLESGSGIRLWENLIEYVHGGAPCEVVFDGSPGTSAPPGSLGGFPMAGFGDDTRPVYDDVVAVPAPGGGGIQFSIPLNHREIGDGWATWSHGYTGDVYYTNGDASVTMYMPGNTVAFYFYVEPNTFAEFEFEAVADTGTTSGTILVNGSSGAKYFGFYMQDRGVLRHIKITNTDGGAGGFAIGEFGIARGEIAYDGSPGTGAPPAMLGPYDMQPFPADPRPVFDDVYAVGGPCGVVEFDIPMNHRRIGDGWATWSHGYTGDVYFTNSQPTVTMFMPPYTGAFYFYVEPNTFAEFEFIAQSSSGTTSGSVFIEGSSGAKYFGFYAPGAGELQWITIKNVDGGAGGFAVGEFACAPVDCGGSNCPEDITGPDGVPDGVVDVLDLLLVLGQWGTGGPEGDITGPGGSPDGIVDVIDLLTILAAWGPGE